MLDKKNDTTSKIIVPIGVSNRHIHLSQKDQDILFGEGYEMKVFRALSQPGQFAYEEAVGIHVGEKSFPKVRILGPVRSQTQIEVSASDARKLRSTPPVRSSGDLVGSSPVTVVGPKGSVKLSEGMIIANRHIHMTPVEAEQYDIQDKDFVSVRVGGEKGGVLDNVLCRVSPNYYYELHIDTDDAAAFMMNTGDVAEIIK